MAAGNNFKDWPTLSDATSTSASAPTSERGSNSKDCTMLDESRNCPSSRGKKRESKSNPDVLQSESGMENPGTSTNGNTTRAPGKKKERKRGSKTKWTPAPKECNLINILPYRDTKNERRVNESNKFSLNGHRSSGKESTCNSANGHESSKGRSYRGGRHGRYSQFQSRHESAQGADCQRYPRVPQGAGSVKPSEECPRAREHEELIRKVIAQIDYYLGPENLSKDTFLRCQMDKDGYVQLSLVATFPRLKMLTEDQQIIFEAVKKSNVLEVSGVVWDDVKIRPIINPLQWPLSKEQFAAVRALHKNYPNIDHVAAQQFNSYLPSSAIQFHPDFKCDTSVNNVFVYPYILNGGENKSDAVLDPMNEYYSEANSDVPNGHSCSSDQHNPPNSDLSIELSSQYMPNDYENEGTSANDIPTDIYPNGSSTADSSNLNGYACSSDQHISSPGSDLCSEFAYPHLRNDCQKKNVSVLNPLNMIHPHVDSNDFSAAVGNLNISDQQVGSSDLRRVNELNAYNSFGQTPNSVILYNRRGMSYAAPPNEILPNDLDYSSEDKSALHNKSPEPTR